MRTTAIGSSLKTKNPLYQKPLRHPFMSLSPVGSTCYPLKFLAPSATVLSHNLPLCLHFWEGLNQQELNRCLSLSPFKNPPVGWNSLTAFTRSMMVQFSLFTQHTWVSYFFCFQVVRRHLHSEFPNSFGECVFCPLCSYLYCLWRCFLDCLGEVACWSSPLFDMFFCFVGI